MKHKLLAVNSGWYLEHPLLGKADIPPRVITGLARTWLVSCLDMIRDTSVNDLMEHDNQPELGGS